MTMVRNAKYLLIVVALASGCTTLRIQKADKAYGLMQYPKSERLYEKALTNSEDRGARARLANSYRQHNAFAQARIHYSLLEAGRPLSGDTALAFGEVLLALGEHQAAAIQFERALAIAPNNARVADLLKSTHSYSDFYSDTMRFRVNELVIPGVVSAFAAVPFKNGLLITGERAMDPANANPWNDRSFLDMYHTERNGATGWNAAEPLPGNVNGAYHDGPGVFGRDGGTLFFTRSNYVQGRIQKDEGNTSHLKLFRATLDKEGQWGDLHEFGFNEEKWSTGHPALSEDGRTLYFASDRPGGSGGSDIWMSTDNGSGWSQPANLGPTVNTAGNELFPTVSGDALYFSSTGHHNMGGLDIFETHQQDGVWTLPTNMKAPINTSKDDHSFVLDSTKHAGYLSSDRSGIDHVYAFQIVDLQFTLDAVVEDAEGGYLIPSEFVLTNMTTDQDVVLETGSDGRFRAPLEPNSGYELRARKEGWITGNNAVSTKGMTRSDEIRSVVRLDPVRIGTPIAVNNIYYDYDKWEIRPDAAIELDRLAKTFIDNPTLRFELGSHTDCRGAEEYNLVLSDARANSAVDYLIRKGVDPNRITAKGYGESVLLNNCNEERLCTEEGHQVNRRTEFTVIAVDGLATIPK